MTGEDVVNAGDVLQLNRYIAKMSSVMDAGTDAEKAERFAAANVTALTVGDTVLNAGDVMQLNRYIAKMSSAFDVMQ